MAKQSRRRRAERPLRILRTATGSRTQHEFSVLIHQQHRALADINQTEESITYPIEHLGQRIRCDQILSNIEEGFETASLVAQPFVESRRVNHTRRLACNGQK